MCLSDTLPPLFFTHQALPSFLSLLTVLSGHIRAAGRLVELGLISELKRCRFWSSLDRGGDVTLRVGSTRLQSNVGHVMRLLVALQSTLNQPEVAAESSLLCKGFVTVISAYVHQSMKKLLGLEDVAAVVAALSHSMAIPTQSLGDSDESYEGIRMIVKSLLERLSTGPVAPYRKDAFGEEEEEE